MGLAKSFLTKEERAQVAANEALREIRELVKPGDTVQTILRHCSRSGMYRVISPIIKGRDISYLVCKGLRKRYDEKHNGVPMGGCGMDMGFALVHELCYALYPKGFTCAGKRCPSSDHVNGDRNYKRHKHTEGGYALKQSWL